MARPSPAAEIELFSGPPPRAAIELRHEVFVREQGIAAELEHDGLDAEADHAVVFGPAGQALANARLLDPAGARPPDGPGGEPVGEPVEPVGVIGRVAVTAAQRGNGLGRLVTAALEDRARERGLPAVELHAQADVQEFYRRQGYRAFGEPDVVAGIDHVWMRRELLPGLRPVADADGPALERLIGAVWAEYPGCVLDVDAEEPWLRAPGSAYAVAEGEPRRSMWVLPGSAGAIAGCVAVRERPDRAPGCELKSLYVAAAARRGGFGAALVRRVERQARIWGHDRLELWSDTRFTDAHRLYHRLGYAPTGRSRDLHDLSATTELEFNRQLPPMRGLRATLPESI